MRHSPPVTSDDPDQCRADVHPQHGRPDPPGVWIVSHAGVYDNGRRFGQGHRMRNGCWPTTVKTTLGPVMLARPKLRGATKQFASQLFGTLVTNPCVGGAGDRRGSPAGCRFGMWRLRSPTRSARRRRCRSRPSWVCEAIKDEFVSWQWRRFDDIELDYLFLTARTSGITRTPPPSRCWRPGAFTPPEGRCSTARTRPASESGDAGPMVSRSGFGERVSDGSFVTARCPPSGSAALVAQPGCEVTPPDSTARQHS
jgi:hypothetical protein